MLIFGSMHDERVPCWMPLKWTAKMRDENKIDDKEVNSSASSRLLCMIDEEGGHFGSGGIDGVFEQVNLSFLPSLLTVH